MPSRVPQAPAKSTHFPLSKRPLLKRQIPVLKPKNDLPLNYENSHPHEKIHLHMKNPGSASAHFYPISLSVFSLTHAAAGSSTPDSCDFGQLTERKPVLCMQEIKRFLIQLLSKIPPCWCISCWVWRSRSLLGAVVCSTFSFRACSDGAPVLRLAPLEGQRQPYASGAHAPAAQSQTRPPVGP